jgi:hypothetical protein
VRKTSELLCNSDQAIVAGDGFASMTEGSLNKSDTFESTYTTHHITWQVALVVWW